MNKNYISKRVHRHNKLAWIPSKEEQEVLNERVLALPGDRQKEIKDQISQSNIAALKTMVSKMKAMKDNLDEAYASISHPRKQEAKLVKCQSGHHTERVSELPEYAFITGMSSSKKPTCYWCYLKQYASILDAYKDEIEKAFGGNVVKELAPPKTISLPN